MSSLAFGLLPPCGYEFDEQRCEQTGNHDCILRGDKVVGFITDVCVHTKSIYARKPFDLKPWQEHEIVRPIFQPVRWSEQYQQYVRVKTLAHIEIGRGNGKSELAAALVLYLLVADGEESAEVYGAAKDKKQAGKVGEVVVRMKQLIPQLESRLVYNRVEKRLSDPVTYSYYEVIPSDAEGELGHNASGVVIDEFLTQASPDLFQALLTAQGKRPESLVICFSTAGQTDGFAYEQHKAMQKIADEPESSPHTFVYLRNTPEDADPWNEENWYYANPALGEFLGIDTLRAEAMDARNDPSKEASFRQFRLNQWVTNVFIWMPTHLYDAASSHTATDPAALRESLSGRYAWGGFDLASRQDLCAWCLFVLPEDEDDPIDVIWRFWIPQSRVEQINKATRGKFNKWIEAGWVDVAPENVVVFEDVYDAIEEDSKTFEILGIDFDSFGTQPVIEEITNRTLLTDEDVDSYSNNFVRMSPGLQGVMELVQQKKFEHHGNPVARWCMENCEVRTSPQFKDLIRVEGVERHKTGKRIDAVPAAAMAFNAWWNRGNREIPEPTYSGGYNLRVV